MCVTGCVFRYLSVPVVTIVGTLLLKSTIVTGTSECSIYDFECENGECIDSLLWCDSHKDCIDGTDEKYCYKRTSFNMNPNKCPEAYFKCKNGPCIPQVGRCDGYNHCGDESDEENCSDSNSTTKNYQQTTPLPVTNHGTTIRTTEMSLKSEFEGYNATRFFSILNVSQNSVQVEVFFGLEISGYCKQRTMARNWLLSQRRDNFGWGDETPRAVMALHLSDQHLVKKTNDIDMLMMKQLEMELSLELSRNETKPMKLTELSLYINALLVSCKNPKNFYGDNLINILRQDVNAAQKKDAFINPSIYLTLCINNVTTYDDTKALQNMILSRNATINNIDMQALAFLTTACIFKRTDFLNASMYDNIKKEFLRKVKIHGFPGNVYEAALLYQALRELKVTITGLISYILKHQHADGSFGDILSTYQVLPILAGRNMMQIKDHCDQRDIPDFIPLEVLKNVKSKKMHVQYFLNYEKPPEVTQTIQMHVAEGTNVLNVMRLAQEINPNYRFKVSENRDVPIIYSIGGMPNDVEKGMYWQLYKALTNNSENTRDITWVPYVEDVRQLILSEGEKVMFWYRSL